MAEAGYSDSRAGEQKLRVTEAGLGQQGKRVAGVNSKGVEGGYSSSQDRHNGRVREAGCSGRVLG